MSEYKANKSIGCTVQQCVHHCGNENYCSLDSIKVGTHETHPTMVECTDCESFRVKAPAASGLQAKKPSKWMAFSYWQISMMACAKIFAA